VPIFTPRYSHAAFSGIQRFSSAIDGLA
jgi:hypothetical protein